MMATVVGRNHDSMDRSNGSCKVTAGLAVVGLVASWLAWILLAQSIGDTAEEGLTDPQGKPFIYYVLHGLGILATTSAGAVAAITGEFHRLSRSGRLCFWLLVGTAFTWAAITYGPADYGSYKALGATGPFVWLSCIAFFAGMNRNAWQILEPVIRCIAYLTAVLALYAIVKDHRVVTERWFSAPVYYMVLLMWFGGWTFLSSWKSRSWRLLLGCFPFVVFVMTTIITQTRSWFLMSILLLLGFLLVSRCSRHQQVRSRPKMLAVFCLLALLFMMAGFVLKDNLSQSITAFEERALNDTRSGQYAEFFSQVPVSDLVIGRGPNGSWDWDGKDYQFFDNALLWTAFIGGLPTLVSYLVLIVFPGFKALKGGATGDDGATAVLVVLWGLACTGFSTYTNPSLTSYSYLICLLAGRCAGFWAERGAVSVATAEIRSCWPTAVPQKQRTAACHVSPNGGEA
ncbi:hypothetical protein [Geotalea sp. SG265]|uniref:hypothetical protein n=1 Tax=Geotalea sp. SG265 TaxID=2922867 RepID=UPI001FAEA41E|nr:hypothetical protein [Geotalea sp. SG265]